MTLGPAGGADIQRRLVRQVLAMDKTAPASILVTGRPWSAG